MGKYTIFIESYNGGNPIYVATKQTASECIEHRENLNTEQKKYSYIVDNESLEIISWRELRKIANKEAK